MQSQYKWRQRTLHFLEQHCPHYYPLLEHFLKKYEREKFFLLLLLEVFTKVLPFWFNPNFLQTVMLKAWHALSVFIQHIFRNSRLAAKLSCLLSESATKQISSSVWVLHSQHQSGERPRLLIFKKFKAISLCWSSYVCSWHIDLASLQINTRKAQFPFMINVYQS